MTPVPLGEGERVEEDLEHYVEEVPNELLGKEAIRYHSLHFCPL